MAARAAGAGAGAGCLEVSTASFSQTQQRHTCKTTTATTVEATHQNQERFRFTQFASLHFTATSTSTSTFHTRTRRRTHAQHNTMPLPSAHSITAAAVPSIGNGSTKAVRNSMHGAMMAATQAMKEGKLNMTGDTLRVAPQDPGDELWKWVQPLLSSGGHILGAPKGEDSAEAEVLKMGIRIVNQIFQGKAFEAKRPEHAIPVLCVLATTLQEDQSALSKRMSNELRRVLRFASEPPLDINLGIDYDEMYKNNVKYPWLKEALDKVDMNELLENRDSAPSWKTIKRSFPQGDCSNKRARFIRRAMMSLWPKKRNKMHVKSLQHECFNPIPSGHPLGDYVLRCWSHRTSSISSRLPRTPPALVLECLDALGLRKGTISDDVLRAGVMRKFNVFQEWVRLQHGHYDSNPSKWSDTLSKFATNINPSVRRYNDMVGRIELMEATSFVPGDLAPEMYGSNTATGYFFLGQGMYYSYSSAWRRDAYAAYVQGRLPPAVNALDGMDKERIVNTISVRDAHIGGRELLNALDKLGIKELQFTKFLRQYYWSGAFLTINLTKANSKQADGQEGEDWEMV